MAKLLLVDNDSVTRKLVSVVVQKYEGLALLEAETLEEAVALYSQNHFGYILMDLVYPHGCVVEFLQKIAELDKANNVRLILFNCMDDELLMDIYAITKKLNLAVLVEINKRNLVPSILEFFDFVLAQNHLINLYAKD